MKVKVRAFGDLVRYMPAGRETVLLEVPEKSTVMSVLGYLGIPESEVWMVTVNGERSQDDRALQDHDEVLVFAPVTGG